MIALETLRKSDVFSGLADEELMIIAKMAHEETYDAGVQVFCENDVAKNLYVVVEGRLVIMIDVARGRQAIIDTVTRGGSFGWSALVPPYTYTGTAQVVDRVRLIAIPGDELRALCKINCAMSYTIMEKLATIVSRRLGETRLQLIGLMYRV